MVKKRWLWVFLILFLSLFSFKSILRQGYFPMHDDMQAMRVLEMDKCIKDGQIPCRWVPDMGYGYGYPQFIYYSPLPYYVMEIFHLFGLQIIDSVKAGIVLGFVLSGTSMFLLGKALWGNLGGLVSAVFYIYTPYHASDIYTRGAMGEFWALVFLPLIFWAIFRYVKEEKQKYLIYLALSLGGLLTTHNITSLVFAPITFLWIIFLLWYFKKWNLYLKLFLASVWGIGFAGFFILPAIFEKKFAHIETMTMGYFNYLAHFISLRQLFASTHWGYGSSELGQYDDLSFAIGIFHWLFSLLALILAFIYRKKEKTFPFVIFIFLLGLSAIFMAHQRSSFIWSQIAILSYFQFPWRFLTIISFATSILAGYLIFIPKMLWIKLFIGFLLISGVIFLNAFYFQPREWYDISDKEKFSGQSWERQLTISIFDYLPIFAKAPPSEKAPDFPVFLSGEGRILSFKKGTNWQRGEIEAMNDSKIQLPIYYFPGMKAWVDNKNVDIDYSNYLGLVSFEIPAGKHNLSVKLLRSPVRVFGDWLTIFSFLVLGIWIAYAKYKK